MPNAKTILTRIILGAIMIAAVGGVLVLEHFDVPRNLGDVRGVILAAVFVVLGVLGFLEIGRLARAAGTGVLTCSGLLGVVVVGTTPVWVQMAFFWLPQDDLWFVLGAIVVLVFLEQIVRYRLEGALTRIAATLLAVMYLGVGAAIMLSIRLNRYQGVPALVLFLAAVKFTDIGAYFTGTAAGRHKLIPWLSPGKSWEGLLGGLAVGAVVSMLVVWGFRHVESSRLSLGLGQAAVFGLAVGAAGQFGDLCESLLKRSAQVKDSGALVPEFGGVLDILDSPLLAAPMAYLLLTVMS